MNFMNIEKALNEECVLQGEGKGGARQDLQKHLKADAFATDPFLTNKVDLTTPRVWVCSFNAA